MKISTRGRYALRLMIDLARQGSEARITLKDISQRQQISVKYLEQIVGSLSRAGLLRSSRGPLGGYRLIKKPEEYTVAEILRAAGESLAPVDCLEDLPNRCPQYATCSSVAFWEGFERTIDAYLTGTTLNDFMPGGAFPPKREVFPVKCAGIPPDAGTDAPTD